MKVMIIGGTSGLGLALGKHYINRGYQVALCGRNPQRLDGDPVIAGGNVSRYKVDVRQQASVSTALCEFSSPSIDLLIISAGQYIHSNQKDNFERVYPMLATNLLGLVTAFDAGVAHQVKHIVAITSMAGLLCNYPNKSPYAASKCGAIAICNTYRQILAPLGITVTTIIPGYIDTARLRQLNGGSTRNKPYLQDEKKAVLRMVSAIERKKTYEIFPWQLHFLVRLFNLLPISLKRQYKK